MTITEGKPEFLRKPEKNPMTKKKPIQNHEKKTLVESGYSKFKMF